MTETVDVQETTIGVGSVIAFAFLAYGIIVSPSIFGINTTAAASWVFAATFAAVSLLHGAYGRRDLALAFGGAAVGWGLVLLGSIPLTVIVGLVMLVAGGSYVAVVMIRERKATRGVVAD